MGSRSTLLRLESSLVSDIVAVVPPDAALAIAPLFGALDDAVLLFCTSFVPFIPLLLLPLQLFVWLSGALDVMSGDEDVDSFDDLDFEEDFDVVRLHA